MATQGDFSSVNKLDKTTVPQQVYITDPGGNQNFLPWDLGGFPLTVAVRDAAGALQVANATSPADAVNLSMLTQQVLNFIVAVARAPHTIWEGAITVDAFGAPISAAVTWPGPSTGTYTGTPSVDFPGSIDAWTITHDVSGLTYVQAAVTRDASGNVIFQPAIQIV